MKHTVLEKAIKAKTVELELDGIWKAKRGTFTALQTIERTVLPKTQF